MHYKAYYILIFTSTSIQYTCGSYHPVSSKLSKHWPKSISCSANHTIYIWRHVIEGNIKQTQSRNTNKNEILPSYILPRGPKNISTSTKYSTLSQHHAVEDNIIKPNGEHRGREESSRVNCSASFPRGHSTFKTQLSSKCNQQQYCKVKGVFNKMEETMRSRVCPGYQHKLEFEHSVGYECLSDLLKKNMCKTASSETFVSSLYVASSNNKRACFCVVHGSVTNFTILESVNSQYTISHITSNEVINITKGQYNKGTYNKLIDMQDASDEEGKTKIRTRSPKGRFLARILGNFRYHCRERKPQSVTMSTTRGNVASTHYNSININSASKKTTITYEKGAKQDESKPSTEKETKPLTMEMDFKRETEHGMERYIMFTISGMMCIGVIIIIVSVFQRRKEQNVLQLILNHVDMLSSSETTPGCRQADESDIRLKSFTDTTYQQISEDSTIKLKTVAVQ